MSYKPLGNRPSVGFRSLHARHSKARSGEWRKGDSEGQGPLFWEVNKILKTNK